MNDFIEKTLEDIIFENQNTIRDRGFTEILEVTERQFHLPSGKFIDLLSWDIKGDVLFANIIELKRAVIDQAAFFQALEYRCEFLSHTLGCFSSVQVEIILVGTSVTLDIKNLITLTTEVVPYLYRYEYDGIHFSKPFQTISDYAPIFKNSYLGGSKDETELNFSNYLREKVYELENEAAEYKLKESV